MSAGRYNPSRKPNQGLKKLSQELYYSKRHMKAIYEQLFRKVNQAIEIYQKSLGKSTQQELQKLFSQL